MSASLWNDIDDKIQAILTAKMGSGTYGTMELVTIQVVDEWSTDLRTSPLGDIALPCAFIVGNSWKPGTRSRYEPQGPHGDGVFHVDMVYPYDLIVASSPVGTYDLALAAAKEMSRRLREAIRDNYALGGIVSTDGEQVIEVIFDRSVVEVRGHDGSKYIGGALLPISIYTQV